MRISSVAGCAPAAKKGARIALSSAADPNSCPLEPMWVFPDSRASRSRARRARRACLRPGLPLADDVRRLRPVPDGPVDRHRVTGCVANVKRVTIPKLPPRFPGTPRTGRSCACAARADYAIRTDDRHVADVVARQPSFRPEADAPAECQPCNADRRTRSTGDRDAVRSEHAIDVHQPAPAPMLAVPVAGSTPIAESLEMSITTPPCSSTPRSCAHRCARRSGRVPPGPDNRFADVRRTLAVDDRERVCGRRTAGCRGVGRHRTRGAPADDGAADDALQRGEVRRLRRAPSERSALPASASRPAFSAARAGRTPDRVVESSAQSDGSRLTKSRPARADAPIAANPTALGPEAEGARRAVSRRRSPARATVHEGDRGPGASKRSRCADSKITANEGPPQARAPATRARRRRVAASGEDERADGNGDHDPPTCRGRRPGHLCVSAPRAAG